MTLLSALVVGATAVGAVPTSATPKSALFTDVPESSPFYADITWMADTGVSTGYAGPTFQPAGVVTRQAMAAFMHRLSNLLGGPIGSLPTPSFDDVPASSPFHDDIAWMASTGIATGYAGDLFKPGAAVTRQALAAFIHRLDALLGGTPGPCLLPGFVDVPDPSPFHDDIVWMAAVGIAEGFHDSSFRPDGTVTRQAMAAFMHRLSDLHHRISIRRVSVATDGTQGIFASDLPAISGDGRFIAFVSKSPNLVPGDTNSATDVFVRDRDAETTTRVSVSSSGLQANDHSSNPSISADGRYITYDSWASDLVLGDTDVARDVFEWDRESASTRRVSVGPGGIEGDGQSQFPEISEDGRTIIYRSSAGNLVPGDIGGWWDVFVWDRDTGTTTRATVASNGTPANEDSFRHSVSADGRYVGYASNATNLVPGDTNESGDAFVWDRQLSTTTRVNIALDGAESYGNVGDTSVSADGRYVGYISTASDLVAGDTNGLLDVFVWDRLSGDTNRVSEAPDGTQGDGESNSPEFSSDECSLTYTSYASNLVPGDLNGTGDVIVRNLSSGATRRVSVDVDGLGGDGVSYDATSSNDGRYIIFTSDATNLTAGDTNGTRDVFLYDRGY